MEASSRGVSNKYIYGSDFPYRIDNDFMNMKIDNVDLLPSLAMGGFSNVWGAAILPYIQEDISDWPIGVEDFKPHYESVLSFLNISANKDELENQFPIYKSDYEFLKPSKQAGFLYEDLIKNKNKLHSAGFKFGYSRLAVRSGKQNGNYGCVYCGLCMYGCPYRLIYSSISTLSELQKYNNFHYINNVYVYKIIEEKNFIRVLAVSSTSGQELIFVGERVYLACGVIPTAKIILESMKEYDEEIKMKDSQYFIFPLLRYKGYGNPVKEDLHTLAQLYMEILDNLISNRTIHLQVYTYNDLYKRAVEKVLGRTYRFFELPISKFLTRLMIVQGFLHSDYSSRISIKLKQVNGEIKNELIISSIRNDSVKNTINKILKKLSVNKKYIRAIPLRFLLRIAQPGKGFHSGGTFPMSKNPLKYQSDLLGRPFGYKLLHIVDASVFPSIPATTITLSVMANSHRIATESVKNIIHYGG
jgi:choline dehydrogenase-like flavoprotein